MLDQPVQFAASQKVPTISPDTVLPHGFPLWRA